MTPNEELDLFKTTPIQTFLPPLGWHPTKAKDTFRKGDEVIEVFKGRGGIYRYKDENKTYGTIVDLVQKELGRRSLADVRRALRPILGISEPTNPQTQTPSSLPQVPSTESSPVPQALKSEQIIDNDKVTYTEALAAYEAGSQPWDPATGIPERLLVRSINTISDLHVSSMRESTSGSGNLRFPYYVRLDDGTVVHGGHETLEARGKKRYAKGTHNGVWRSSGPHITGKTAVVGESPVDVLSYDEIHPCAEGRHLFALRSGTEVMCIDMIRDMIDQELIDTVIIVTDNDPAGMTYAGKALTRLQAGRDKTKRGPKGKYYKGVRAYYHAPDDFREDWNDVSADLDCGISLSM